MAITNNKQSASRTKLQLQAPTCCWCCPITKPNPQHATTANRGLRAVKTTNCFLRRCWYSHPAPTDRRCWCSCRGQSSVGNHQQQAGSLYWRRYAAQKSALEYLCQLILQQTKTAKYIIGTDTQTHESRAAYLPAEKNKTESNNSNAV